MNNEKKKVLLDLERLRYPNSGIANVFRNLAIGLTESSNDLDFKISLFASKNTLLKIRSLFPVVYRKDIHKFFSFYTRNYDVLHSSHQLSAFFHSKRNGQKKIVTLHDLNFLHEKSSLKKRNKMLRKVKRNIENTDVIVCISEFTKQDLLANKKLFTYKFNPEIIVIHNGMQFPELKTYSLDSMSFLKEKKYILNIGVLFPKKNQLLLVKMLACLKQDLVLVVSGEKEHYKNEVVSEIERLNLRNRVHIVRNISEEEKWALIQNCESMCHPSVAEGFGIPPIEAMYFGKPVFLSNLTSLPEIGGEVANYFTSLDVDSMQKVYKKGMEEYYLDSDTKSTSLSIWAKKYSYIEMTKNYMNLYRRLF
jgi:glycosyltransferase involved in cell wall biosynthesis